MPPTVLTPELAVRRLGELSAEVRTAILLDARGDLAAVRDGNGPASGPASAGPGSPSSPRAYSDQRLAELARELARVADGVEDVSPWSQVEVVTPVGAVFAARHRGWTLVATCTRDALPSLTFLDLRSVLEGLADAAG